MRRSPSMTSHRDGVRGSRARRARPRSTSSRVPGPRQGTTGMPRRVTSVSCISPLEHPHPPRQSRGRVRVASGLRQGPLAQGVHADDAESAPRQGHHHRGDLRGQQRGEHHHDRPGTRAQPELARAEQLRPARLHLGEQLLQPALVPEPGAGAEHLPGATEDPQRDPVADADVMRGQGARGADRRRRACSRRRRCRRWPRRRSRRRAGAARRCPPGRWCRSRAPRRCAAWCAS